MIRYYVLDTEQEAADLVAHIDARARLVFAAQGYTITEDGAVVSRRASDGADVPGAVTTTWDVPRQRVDGKWCVQHPETHASAQFDIGGGVTVLQFVTTGLSAAIETADPSWWPET